MPGPHRERDGHRAHGFTRGPGALVEGHLTHPCSPNTTRDMRDMGEGTRRRRLSRAPDAGRVRGKNWPA
jgi:hypothetical protein